MAELLVIRHAQASFGQDNYDRLSDLGHRQSELAGDALRANGWVPDRLLTGTLTRQAETLRSMGFDAAPEQHAGFNEYDFHDLLHVKFGGKVPDMVKADRKTHFRTLRETILEWQAGGLVGARETWLGFAARVAEALVFATQDKAERVLVVSSGGPIGQLTASTLGAPPAQMMNLNLQVKNTSMTKFVFSRGRVFLHQFNATPHLDSAETAPLLTYS
ncbi:histidine phosphatase family protein [Sulfitobacter sabulilitoris]|uniref:Histidine phosphatase family protein n=1 Tax=Sulfitobacter sabulilitoris TaxID=2562655 RepID=A0A5S3PLL4_9RHOB|nr:histidine phosphatase family protein [Sulfitobacter sabulilitoris]TMM55298.1 histidine phosphatase family protein [Sulfitobacter sabulilitoris]